ncbi:hypothetical protein I3843_06G120200 [Carya illinoinensis]|nr:hypothetical protein I3843_06G120200 [Carya illinoinensis]
MDMTLSCKPQTITLLTWNPLPSSSSSKLRSMRGEFLGCLHTLRPPPAAALRTRRKLSRAGLGLHSPRFLFRASLNSHSSFLVVVLAAFTFSVVFLKHYRRKKSDKEVPRPPDFALFKVGQDIMNWIFESQILGFGELGEGEERKWFRHIIAENSHTSADKEAPLLSQTPALMVGEVTVSKTLLPPGCDVLTTFNSSTSFKSEENDVGVPSFSTAIFGSCALKPLTSTEEMATLQAEGSEVEIASSLELPTLMGNIKLSAASVNINDSPAEVNECNEENVEHGEEGKTISYDIFLGDSAREELYMFYEPNESMEKSKASSSASKSFSHHAYLLNGNKYSSLTRNTAPKKSELSTEISLQAAEYVDGKVPVANYKEGLPYRRRDSGKGNGFPRDRKIRNLNKKVHQSFPLLPHPHGMIRNLNDKNDQSFHQLPHPNGMQVTDGKHLSEQLSAYNRLLRAGRLTECVELLEDMERNSLLDMNKVYHARFFEKCKSQKAVNEAFRYTKLIPNPTLSTFNMLMSVCGNSQDSEAFQVLRLVQEAGLKVDCKLYTTLISTCAKSGKVDLMFEVFHEMVNAGVEPNVHTYGALIDGCARAGQVAKAFGAYGIMRSKNVKPDRVVFNALITACGQSGAVDRAFDVLAEMGAETQPIDPDHITVGALIRACANAGQVDRAQEVYKMIHQYNIKGTPEVYTIAVNCCGGDWGFACRVYDDMTRKGVVPDEMFLSVLIDAAGHAGKLDAAFEILEKARDQGINIGIVAYSSLMGACSKAKNWQKALGLYDDLKSMKMRQTVSTVNALITALCDGDQLQKAMEVLSNMKGLGLSPNCITYSILLVASEKKDDLDAGLMLLSQAKRDRISLNPVMCRCIIGMCLRRFVKACTLGEPVVSFDSGRPQVDNKWTSVALMVYRDAMVAGVMPTMEVLSQVLGCLHLPYDASLQDKLIENLGVSVDVSRCSNLYSLIDGFGEYDPRAFSIVEEAASLGIVPCVSLKSNPVVVDVRNLQIHTAEVYLLTVLKGLKHRLAAGAKLPNITILLPSEKTQVLSPKGERTINLAGRVSQAVAALLRRLGLQYQGNESYGKIRINGLVLRRWFQPKLAPPFMGKPGDWSSSQSRLGKGITHQQRDIRTGNLSSE